MLLPSLTNVLLSANWQMAAFNMRMVNIKFAEQQHGRFVIVNMVVQPLRVADVTVDFVFPNT